MHKSAKNVKTEPVDIDKITSRQASAFTAVKRLDTPRPQRPLSHFRTDIPNQDGFIYYFNEEEQQAFDAGKVSANVQTSKSSFGELGLFGSSSKTIDVQSGKEAYSPVGVSELDSMDMETDPSLIF